MRKGSIRKIALVTAFALTFAGCSKPSKGLSDESLSILKDAPTSYATATPIPTVTPTETPTPEPDNAPEGKAKSMLTGLWVDQAIAKNRPYAVMLNNLSVANPQSGIGDASVLYEALVEGGITRLMGVFENIDEASKTAKRLGSVRSARHYYVSFADEYDAILIHFGQTSYAKRKIKALKIDTINGTEGIGCNSYYRDKSIKAPHNAFISLDGIKKAIKAGKYRTTYEDGYESHFLFYNEDTVLNSDQKVNKITIKFSQNAKPVLEYDSATGLYMRSQFKGPHIDYNTKEQLSFKNIIVQFVKEWDIDKNGYQTMDLEKASGEGYYISNGELKKITWKKNESTRIMRYYDANGDILTMNPGKTYIAVFPNSRVSDVVLE